MNDDDINFLRFPFDWYILDRWDNSSSESRRQQHIRLGIEFANLGHKGRRPYVVSARGHAPGPPISSRPPEEVPQDLLTTQERSVQESFGRIWVRTDYSAGTDDRQREMMDARVDLHGYLGSKNHIFDDSSRYDFDSLQNPQTLFAFFPSFLSDGPMIGGPYTESIFDWESSEVQEQLWDPELPNIINQRVHQRPLFIADRQAMRTGFLLWLQPDEFGQVSQQNRIQPWSLSLACIGFGEEIRDEDGEDFYMDEFGMVEGESLVYPWEPPASQEIASSLSGLDISKATPSRAGP